MATKATPREVIERLRRKWGFHYTQSGTGPGTEEKRTVHRLQQALHRTLETLAKDIYTSNSHFLLELIQNADDNRYREGVVPMLEVFVPVYPTEETYGTKDVSGCHAIPTLPHLPFLFGPCPTCAVNAQRRTGA